MLLRAMYASTLSRPNNASEIVIIRSSKDSSREIHVYIFIDIYVRFYIHWLTCAVSSVTGIENVEIGRISTRSKHVDSLKITLEYRPLHPGRFITVITHAKSAFINSAQCL